MRSGLLLTILPLPTTSQANQTVKLKQKLFGGQFLPRSAISSDSASILYDIYGN
jgi:hypothetical protein